MIFEIVFQPIFDFISWIINKLPIIPTDSNSLNGFIDIMNIGFSIVPITPVIVVFTCVIAWTIIHMSWNVIEWLAWKIPFINIR